MSDVIKKLFDLTGEVAVITGGLGLLGSEYAKTLAHAGAFVALVDVRDKIGPKVDGLIKAGFPVSTYKADITKKEEVKLAFEEIVAKLGAPTVLINNAGLDSPPHASAADNGPFEDVPESTWDAFLDSHLKGMFLVSQEFIRAYRVSYCGEEPPSPAGRASPSKRAGSIINISSTYGVVTPDQSLYNFRRRAGEQYYKPVGYSVAKSGVLNFTRWLAEYCAPFGIRVNTLVPGGIYDGQNEEFVREYSKRTVLGRMAEPHEYNAAILFLASHKASAYKTGATMIIDGGWTAR